MSGCAYCIFVDEQLIRSKVHHVKLHSSFYAELYAFEMLLQYIRQHVKPDADSSIKIYGDSKSLVDMMKSNKKNRKYKSIKKFFVRLQSLYNLSLHHIPRKENKIAHKLARQEYVPILKPAEIKKLYGEDRSFDESRNMSLDDIRIPNYIKHGRAPRYENYIPRLLYYQRFGCDYKTIRIDPNGFLCEGYITYLILKEHGISTCNVDVIKAS